MSIAADFSSVREVLDVAAARGQRLTLWLRDDDAVRDTPALDRLFELGRTFDLPVAIAAIPSLVEPSLPPRLAAEPGARALVHGWTHADHEPAGAKRAEFGRSRDLSALLDEAACALQCVRSSFGERALPVFVPPWNRVHPDLPVSLPALGYRGLSTFAPRPAARLGDLTIVNTHLDPVAWRGTRGGVAPEALAAALARSLPADGSPPEPIGILTHHLQFDDALWLHTARLLDVLRHHRSVSAIGLDELWRAERH